MALEISEPYLTTGTVIRTVGVLFRLRNEEDTVARWDRIKETWRKWLEEKIGDKPYGNFVEINMMPCGEQFLIKTPDDLCNLPMEDVPCPCGDPTHWFIKLERWNGS